MRPGGSATSCGTRCALPSITSRAARFPPTADTRRIRTPPSRWILARLHETVAEFDRLLDEYRFSDAYGLLYTFAWSEVFDWYLEMAKTPLRNEEQLRPRRTLGVVIRDLLKLFHPVIPYVTEELWSELVGDGLVAAASWPTPPSVRRPHRNGRAADVDCFAATVPRRARYFAKALHTGPDRRSRCDSVTMVA